MIGIYKITSPTKKVYIGQSTNLEKRLKMYKGLYCKGQPAIYSSFLKYGFEKHKFEVLCECDILELNDKERYYQDVFSATGKNGLNCKLTKSSDRNGKHSEETKRKIGLANTGKIKKHSEETILRIALANTGKKRTEEQKKKMSESHKGKTIPEEQRRKISESHKGKKFSEKSKNKMTIAKSKIILNTETGIYYYGRNDAAKSININTRTLSNYLIGRNKNKTPFIYV